MCQEGGACQLPRDQTCGAQDPSGPHLSGCPFASFIKKLVIVSKQSISLDAVSHYSKLSNLRCGGVIGTSQFIASQAEVQGVLDLSLASEVGASCGAEPSTCWLCANSE